MGRGDASRRALRVCVACNEDGYGPSAFAFYVVKAMIEARRGRGAPIRVTVLNKRALDFNRAIYQNFPEVACEPVDGFVKLEKRDGETDVPRTLRRLARYAEERGAYFRRAEPFLTKCDAAMDVGLPLFARAAKRLGVPCLTLMDHSWAATLRGNASRETVFRSKSAPTDADRQLAERIAREIEQDEACASELYVFDHFLTPPEFTEHYARIGMAPRIVPGVLGGRAEPAEARRKLNGLLAALGQREAAPEERLVLVSPGGTPVWDGLLPGMIEGYLERMDGPYTPVFSRPRVAPALKERMRRSGRALWFDYGPASTQQAMLPAFDLVVTRAGGGTVNDGLAARVPFVCVEEPQWQVALIRRECVRLGLTPDPPETKLEAFRRNPVQCVDAVFRSRVRLASPVPAGAERAVAEAVLGLGGVLAG